MTDHLRIALAQLNPVVGDIEGNMAMLINSREEAARKGVELLVASELFVTGYPPEDLVLRRAFISKVEEAVLHLAAKTGDAGPGLLIGAPWRDEGKLYNAALLLDEGKVTARRYKHELPNYGVFDEQRIFEAGPLAGPVSFRGVRLGVMLCEDMWFEDVSETLAESGAQILIVLNGSPYEKDKDDVRLNLAVSRVVETGLPLIYVNQVGGQDELVFDGGSFVLDSDQTLRVQAVCWGLAQEVSDWSRSPDGGWCCADGNRAPGVTGIEAVYLAMLVGLRDYVDKNRFPGLIVGMSGGIDSALSAAVAVDALGPSRVRCVRMPSRYSSDHSLEDARSCAELLSVACDTIPIEEAHRAFESMLAEQFSGHDANEAEENIQARVRGLILMALSNKWGHMVLTTGNKSEMSVGYATLYGDMCGGFSVLKDVYKTAVYQLAEWRNRFWLDGFKGPSGLVIPENIITKEPSAELRPNQRDQDSLPAYDQLDDILQSLVEDELSIEEICARGHDVEIVTRIRRLLYIAEYKRRQGPPGVKITRRAFGRDRRYPITNGFLGAE
ncbi:MAG: Glutamine-dependent NAD(+) synthetase [Alphaproteobacteria bacterium MarineAlpha9_Bin7]|nr:MAG: Glutamine-dependent NAD(+) synthetase [Alphaproteobacteria bacterium MarineAlpha9_Bin7]